MHGIWVAKRANAMSILEDHATGAAQLCVDAVKGYVETINEDGDKGYEIVPLGKRLSSAWDVLDRTGNKAVEKSVVAHVSLQDMIIDAYRKRQQRGNGGQLHLVNAGQDGP